MKSRRSRAYSGLISVLLFAALGGPADARAEARLPELVVYAYDSLVAPGGLGPEIFPEFEKKHQCRIRAISVGDGGQLLTRLQLDSERKKPVAHIALGLDQNLWGRARDLVESSGRWRPSGYSRILPELVQDAEGFVPFDYGVFAFMADTRALREQGLTPPKSLRDLLDPRWKRSLILEDPRTSAPGLAFLLYTREVLKDSGVWDFWRALKGQWLTLAPGWDGAYSLFLKSEAPLVWSYTSSQAYHVEKGERTGRYQALLFDEGQPIQIEAAALVKGSFSDSPQGRQLHGLARKFLEYLLSPEVQRKIPRKNWMLPAVRGVPLPESFRSLPKPKKLLRPRADDTKELLRKWSETIAR